MCMPAVQTCLLLVMLAPFSHIKLTELYQRHVYVLVWLCAYATRRHSENPLIHVTPSALHHSLYLSITITHNLSLQICQACKPTSDKHHESSRAIQPFFSAKLLLLSRVHDYTVPAIETQLQDAVCHVLTTLFINNYMLPVLKVQVRVLAAAVLSSMLEGPAQKAYMIIAEATSSARPPVRYTSWSNCCLLDSRFLYSNFVIGQQHSESTLNPMCYNGMSSLNYAQVVFTTCCVVYTPCNYT